MSRIGNKALFVIVVIFVSGCYTLKLGQNTSLTHSGSIVAAWSSSEEYKKPPVVDPNDFLPAGGEMITDTDNKTTTGLLEFAIDFRERLDDRFYLGLTSTYVSFGLNGMNAGNKYNRQIIRSTTMHWWNLVPAEDVGIIRGPSIGFTIGFMNDTTLGIKQMIQYSLSVRRYELDVKTYRGVDCRDCPNGSELKNRVSISSGAAWRNSIEIGYEILHLVIWFELDGSKQATGGLGFAISDFLFKK